jgi:hypothetical protein
MCIFVVLYPCEVLSAGSAKTKSDEKNFVLESTVISGHSHSVCYRWSCRYHRFLFGVNLKNVLRTTGLSTIC